MKWHLIGYNGECVGITTDKPTFKSFKQQRLGYDYKTIKAPINQPIPVEKELCNWYGTPMTSSEEEYYMESIDQTFRECLMHTKKLGSMLPYLRFTDDEMEILKRALGISYRIGMLVTDGEDDEDGDCMEDYFEKYVDQNGMAKFFIDYVIDGKEREL